MQVLLKSMRLLLDRVLFLKCLSGRPMRIDDNQLESLQNQIKNEINKLENAMVVRKLLIVYQMKSIKEPY